MAEAELRNMIMNFRVSDLQVLLGFAGRNKTGKKQELQHRAMELVKMRSPPVDMKIRELHSRRYQQQIVRSNSYELPERTQPPERPPAHLYEPTHVNNNYHPSRYNPNLRSTMQHHGASSSYSSSSSKAYAPSSSKTYAPSLSNKTYAPALSGKAYAAASSSSKSYAPHPANANHHLRYNTSYANVKFKDLPFYDNLYCLVQPSSLVGDSPDRLQETSFYFTLTASQAEDIAMSKGPNGYECQILLRFCLLDTSCEQEDCFPHNPTVKLNNKLVPLPNPIPSNKPAVEAKRPSRPVNMTSIAKLSPTVTNVITVNWSATYGRAYAVGVFMARHLTPQTLVERLKSNGVRNPDYTTRMIKEKLQQQDSDIATTSLRGSLICPLGKIRMELPCRSVTCNHLQCFEALLYIQMNEKRPKWICPVCDKPAPLKMLALDGLFVDIVSKVNPDCSEVEFFEDGSWTPLEPVKEHKEAQPEASSAKPSVEVVEILDSDSDENWSYDPDPQSAKAADDSPLSPNSMFLPPNPPENYSRAFSDVTTIENDSVCILPDLASNPDASMPSTSSSPVLNTTAFPQLPFLNEAYYNSNAAVDQAPSQGTTSYNSFDFLSLLQIPDVEPQKGGKDAEGKDTPDVISLD